jgi:hypothetical protein
VSFDQVSTPRTQSQKPIVGHDKPVKRHVVLGRTQFGAPSALPPSIPRCSIKFLISIKTPRNGKRPMKNKSQKIRDALASGDTIAALRIAAHFHDRSASTLTYKRGLDAFNHPDFCRQIGKDPQQMTATAVLLLQANFHPRVTNS